MNILNTPRSARVKPRSTFPLDGARPAGLIPKSNLAGLRLRYVRGRADPGFSLVGAPVLRLGLRRPAAAAAPERFPRGPDGEPGAEHGERVRRGRRQGDEEEAEREQQRADG